MLSSIPRTALEIGLNIEDYKNIAKNLRRMMLISEESKQDILNRANKELSSDLTKKAKSLIKDMEHETSGFYRLAGLDYALGPNGEQNVFIYAVADYLLRNKDRFH